MTNFVTRVIILAFFFVSSFQLMASPDANEHSDNRLFHVERSKNKNIVCYDVNLNGAALDITEPIKVYWINREDRIGERDGLSAIQKKLAFGYKVKSKDGSSAHIAINACPDRDIKIEKDIKSYKCFTQIDKQAAVLTKIFVKTKDSNSLKVEYVELSGISLISGKPINEKIYNN